MIDIDQKPGADLQSTDPYERQAQIFPRLTREMTDRIAGYGRIEDLPAGTTVFSRGERSVDFLVVLKGCIEIFELDGNGEASVLTTHSEQQFTGEVDLFNDRAILVSGRTASDSTVVRVPRDAFRKLVVGESDIGEILMRAFILRRTGLISHSQGGVIVVGPGHDGRTLHLQRFLTRNGYPLRLFDSDVEDAESFLHGFDLGKEQLPVVILPGRDILRNPTIACLADHLGLGPQIDEQTVFDIAIVGGGPAGLAAAVYAASEGLSTIVLESNAPGGQAGTSSKIENYLGFPTGISGQALAGRAQIQAQKFGAQLAISRAVTGLDCAARPFALELDDGRHVKACSVVVATGARYRTLDLENFAKYEGQGIHYAATAMEQQLCGNEEVIVVGGGNSAGQAAVFLSRTTAHVHMLVRADGLAATMSDYLVKRIEQSASITLHTECEITALGGDERLRQVTWTNRTTGEETRNDIGNIFLMIGAEPNSEWLGGCLTLDKRGFIETGRDSEGNALPSPYMTTKPGIFAIGDVRSGSVKRVASSVGEGSVVIQAVHQFLNPPE